MSRERNCPHCGCEIDATPPKPTRKPRSVPQHKRYFAMIRAAHSHWPENHRFKPTSEEHLRKWLQAKSSYHVIKTVDTAGMTTNAAIVAVAAELANAAPMHWTAAVGDLFHIIESKSIDFDTLPHLDACALFDAVADTIRSETGLDPDAIMPPIRSHVSSKREIFSEVPL